MTTAKVPYRRLGRSGLKVSVPILGAMSFGSDKWFPWVVNEQEALPVLKYAWDRGINTFDTSNNYSNGESERILAKFIKENNIPRSQVVILTKCWGLVADEVHVRTYIMPELQHVQKYQNQYGLSRASIFNNVEGSLERLGTTYIDLYQIHRHDQHTPPEETMKALHDLIQMGKIRYIGASTMRAIEFARYNEVAEKNGWTKFVSMQNEYSLLYREEEREMMRYCQWHGIGVIPWGPVAAGLLTRPLGTSDSIRSQGGGDLPETDKQIISRVEEIAKKKGKNMSQVALAWAIAKGTIPIVGISKKERVDDNIEANEVELTEEEIKYLEEPYAPKPVRGLFEDW